jgi:hypothetical protein
MSKIISINMIFCNLFQSFLNVYTIHSVHKAEDEGRKEDVSKGVDIYYVYIIIHSWQRTSNYKVAYSQTW